MSSCRECGTANPDSAVFCRSCGRPLGPAITCVACGGANPPDGQYCIRCGRPLTAATPAGVVEGRHRLGAEIPYESEVPDLNELEDLGPSYESVIGDDRVDWNEIERLLGGLVDETAIGYAARLAAAGLSREELAGSLRDAANREQGIFMADCIAGAGLGPVLASPVVARPRQDHAEFVTQLNSVLETPPPGTRIPKNRPVWQ